MIWASRNEKFNNTKLPSRYYAGGVNLVINHLKMLLSNKSLIYSNSVNYGSDENCVNCANYGLRVI